MLPEHQLVITSKRRKGRCTEAINKRKYNFDSGGASWGSPDAKPSYKIEHQTFSLHYYSSPDLQSRKYITSYSWKYPTHRHWLRVRVTSKLFPLVSLYILSELQSKRLYWWFHRLSTILLRAIPSTSILCLHSPKYTINLDILFIYTSNMCDTLGILWLICWIYWIYYWPYSCWTQNRTPLYITSPDNNIQHYQDPISLAKHLSPKTHEARFKSSAKAELYYNWKVPTKITRQKQTKITRIRLPTV